MLIICSNDIELNPGPVVYKICPNCGNKAAHIKKKLCPCGHIFRSKTGKSCTASSTSGTTDNDITVTADKSSNSGYPTVAEGTVHVVDNTITKSTGTTVVDASDIKSAFIGDNVIDNSVKSAGMINEGDSVSVSIDDNAIDSAINKSAGVVDPDDSMSASIDNNVNTEYVTCTQDSDKGPTISKWDK